MIFAKPERKQGGGPRVCERADCAGLLPGLQNPKREKGQALRLAPKTACIAALRVVLFGDQRAVAYDDIVCIEAGEMQVAIGINKIARVWDEC